MDAARRQERWLWQTLATLVLLLWITPQHGLPERADYLPTAGNDLANQMGRYGLEALP
ncbi:hypothetical protein [Isoalcanivorax beigongshangi]|uniref:Uncharacterized protein n=1 Tax=Isoalcanivorax beigongshangi TaxID=3238810 RepID=A0ABV4AHJ6_9GAMM